MERKELFFVKKFCLLCSLVLLFCISLVLPFAAQTEYIVQAESAKSLTGGAVLVDDNKATGGKCLLLEGKEAEAGYEITVPAPGKYRIRVTFRAADTAENVVCGFQTRIDGKIYTMVTDKYEVYTRTWVIVFLSEGTHTLSLLAPENYDGTAVKSCRIDQFEVLNEESLPPIGQDTTGDPPNPDTADRQFLTVALTVLITAAAGCSAVALRRRTTQS